MDWWVIVQPVLLFIGGAVVVVLAKLAYRLLRADKGSYELNRVRSGGFFDFGGVKTAHGGFRDYQVQAGLAVNTEQNTWVEQGMLSEEAVDAVLLFKAASK